MKYIVSKKPTNHLNILRHITKILAFLVILTPAYADPVLEDDDVLELYRANTRQDQKIDALQNEMNALKTKINELDQGEPVRRRTSEGGGQYIRPANPAPAPTPWVRPERGPLSNGWNGPR